MPRSARERDRVAHVGKPGDVGERALEAEAEASVRYRAVAAQVAVPASCTGWNAEPSERWTNEIPALESRRVRTQPLTVTGESFGASPARMLRTLNPVLSTGEE
jgi:hypothetical protein